MTHCIVEIILKVQSNNNVILLQSYIASSLHRLPYFRTLGMALKFGSIIQVFRINILYESDIIIDLTKLKASVPLMCMYKHKHKQVHYATWLSATATVPLLSNIDSTIHTIGASHDYARAT